VVLLGPLRQDVSVCEYLAICHGIECGPAPALELETEAKVQRLCRSLIADGLLRSAHDCSEGGLAVAIAESCIVSGLGFVGQPAALDMLIDSANGRADLALFGEGQSRIVVSCPPEYAAEVLARAAVVNVDALLLGTVDPKRIAWKGSSGWTVLDTKVDNLSEAWSGGLERLFV
jgi:phosphoribosylformylglycinamidine synthase subunit PurL